MEIIALALDHHQAGRRDEAEALYQQALGLAPHEPTGLYLYGLFSFEAGRVEAAADLFQAVVAARPDHAEGHVALANLRHWQEAHGAAIAGYRRALALAPDHGGALLGLANALRESGEAEAAIAAALDAVSRRPEDVAVRMALGAAQMGVDDVEGAIASYRAAGALEPRAIDPKTGLALALIAAGRLDEALAMADEALMLAPQSGEAWFLLGTALNGLGKPEEAVAALERAVKIDPNRAAAHLNLGNAYVELDQAEAAGESLLRALALDPTLKEAHASLGSVYLLAGEPEAAEHHCRLALSLDPELTVAHQNLAALLAARGEIEQARWHRDHVYSRQNLFIEPAVRPDRTVLVLTTSESGNVPHRFLLPRDRYTRLNWFIEYAEEGQAERLPAYDAVFNAVGDADLAGPTRAPTEAFRKTWLGHIVNDPAKVALTARHDLPALLAGIDGVFVPAVARLRAKDIARKGLAAAVAASGVAPPALVRPLGSHGGLGLIRVESLEALDAVALAPGQDAYVTAFQDFQSSDGWWRKYRMIFVDRRAFPYHLAISKDWLVHYESADMPGDPARVAEERRFLDDPAAALGPAALAAVQAIGRRMDLDYCGVDFSLLPDGRVLVFEANATMLVHTERADGPLAHKNKPVQAICSAFQALIDR